MKAPSDIVAFFARGREIGFVILVRGEVVRYGVRTVRGKKLSSDLVRRLERLLAPVLATAGPFRTVVIEKTADLPRKGALCRAISKLTEKWRGQGYRVRLMPLKKAKTGLCGRPGRQREVIQAVAHLHPLLWPLARCSTVQQATYWKKVLLAAALAEIAHQQHHLV